MKIKLLILLSIALVHFNLEATTLSFIPGAKATYHIVQTSKMEAETAKQPSALQSSSEITFELSLLSPNEVELVIRKLAFNVSAQGLGYSKPTYSYNSTELRSHCPLEANLSQLIHVPLHFKLEGEFAAVETTGQLKAVLGMLSDPFEASIRECILGGSERDYQFLLTQIFHLSNQTLDTGKPLAVTLAPFWAIPDEPWAVGLKFNLKKEKNQYLVSLPLTGNTIQAKWEGTLEGSMHITQEVTGKLDGKMQLSGSVTWNAENALLQQRNVNFSQQFSGKVASYSSKNKTTTNQIWETKALE